MPAMPTDRQNWRDKAKCKDTPLEEVDSLFFPKRGGKTSRAKSFCTGCLVRTQCLHYSLFYNEQGVWGGMSETDRNAIPQVIGILSASVVQSSGVDTTETREYRHWGMTESQIQQERKERRKQQERLDQQQYPVEPETPTQDQQLQVLVVVL